MEQGHQFSVVEYFGQVVEKVSKKLLPCLAEIDEAITGVHYLHGHPREIIETLMQKDKSPSQLFNKYPLVCLFQDFTEKWHNHARVEATTNIIICNSTLSGYKANERYTKNFLPILYPIFDELIKGVQKHPNTIGYHPDFVKIDRLFWGKAGLYGNLGNIFNDKLDAIELVNLKLNLNTINC